MNRAKCPWCRTVLSGEIIHNQNYYKLDNGDPDTVESTQCPKCSKHVFTVGNGCGLVKGYEHLPKRGKKK
jgi:hypothetical protein